MTVQSDRACACLSRDHRITMKNLFFWISFRLCILCACTSHTDTFLEFQRLETWCGFHQSYSARGLIDEVMRDFLSIQSVFGETRTSSFKSYVCFKTYENLNKKQRKKNLVITFDGNTTFFWSQKIFEIILIREWERPNSIRKDQHFLHQLIVKILQIQIFCSQLINWKSILQVFFLTRAFLSFYGRYFLLLWILASHLRLALLHVIKNSVSFIFEAAWTAINQSPLWFLHPISIRNGKIRSLASTFMISNSSLWDYL